MSALYTQYFTIRPKGYIYFCLNYLFRRIDGTFPHTKMYTNSLISKSPALLPSLFSIFAKIPILPRPSVFLFLDNSCLKVLDKIVSSISELVKVALILPIATCPWKMGVFYLKRQLQLLPQKRYANQFSHNGQHLSVYLTNLCNGCLQNMFTKAYLSYANRTVSDLVRGGKSHKISRAKVEMDILESVDGPEFPTSFRIVFFSLVCLKHMRFAGNLLIVT